MANQISNIKVTSPAGVIVNWWRLNYETSSKHFADTGQGDEDFYTFWYSTCYILAALQLYAKKLSDVDGSEEMVIRFLKSRDIAYTDTNTLPELVSLYEGWVSEIEKRGTARIKEYAGQSEELASTGSAGVGINANHYSLVGELNSGALTLGAYHDIEFDALFADFGATTRLSIDGSMLDNGGSSTFALYIANEGSLAGISGNYTFTYRSASEDAVFSGVLINSAILNHIKISRIGLNVYLYVNGVYIGTDALSTNSSYSFINLFSSEMPYLANLVLTVKDAVLTTTDQYRWKFNEGASFTVGSNHAPLYSGLLAVDSNYTFGDVWVQDDRFANTGVVGLDGELRRLLNWSNDECLLEMLSVSELGLCIDVCSPISEEASCINLNKSYEKGTTTCIEKYPLLFNATIKPYFDLTYITYDILHYNTEWFGLNYYSWDNSEGEDNPAIAELTIADIKPIGLFPIIPISVAQGVVEGETEIPKLDGYEISFVIKSTDPIKLKFGVIGIGSTGHRILSATKHYADGGVSSYFLDDSNFSMCENQEIWVRGVYSLSKLPNVSDTLNIGSGDNLYANSIYTKSILPFINFQSPTGALVSVQIKDIVVRPLSLNTCKGIIGAKNFLQGFLKNNSGRGEAYVQNFIDSKLIPYNCTTNINFL